MSGSLDRILDGEQEQRPNDEAWNSRNDVRGPPPEPQDICVHEVDAYDEGQAVAVVNAPGDDPGGDPAGPRGERVGYHAAGSGSADGLAHGDAHPKHDQLPVSSGEAHQHATQAEKQNPQGLDVVPAEVVLESEMGTGRV